MRAQAQYTLEVRSVETNGMPEGICGRVTYVGLPYNQPDYYGTMFRPGCMARSAAEKLPKGRVKFFADHTYRIATHVGVVRKIEDVAETAIVTAELLDTDAGHAARDYAVACMKAGASTGASIGFYDRSSEWVEVDGVRILAYNEVELIEFSMTPMPAIEGADLLAARHEGGDRQQILRRALDQLIETLPETEVRAAIAARYGNATTPSDSAPPATRDAESGDSQATGAQPVSMDDRIAAVRQSFALSH